MKNCFSGQFELDLRAAPSRAAKVRSLCLPLAIAIAAMLSGPAHAQRTTVSDAAGGNGGGPFRLSCPSGMVMIGLEGRHGEWVDALAPICAIWVRGNRTLGEVEEQPGTGGSGGGPGWLRCAAPRGVIVGMYVWTMRSRPFVGRIWLECGDYLSPSTFANKLGGGPDGLGTTFDVRHRLRCGRDEVAVGIFGRSGAFIDRVGLLCQRAQELPR